MKTSNQKFTANPLVNLTIKSGNLIPHEWYKRFTNKRGAADTGLTDILAEILYWYRPTKVKDSSTDQITYVNKFKGDAWQSSYEHFEKKFNLNRHKIRRIFVKLEGLKIISREFRTVTVRGQKYNNRLFIHLHIENLITKKEEQVESFNTLNNQALSASEFAPPYLQICREHNIDIKNKNKYKDRSRESSNFIIENKREEGRRKSVVAEHPKKLIEFYPLDKAQCEKLQITSDRDFSLNAMNEILKDLARKRPDHSFPSERAFMAYMTKVLIYEMRDAVKISNESFKIKNNYSITRNKEMPTQEPGKILDFRPRKFLREWFPLSPESLRKISLTTGKYLNSSELEEIVFQSEEWFFMPNMVFSIEEKAVEYLIEELENNLHKIKHKIIELTK